MVGKGRGIEAGDGRALGYIAHLSSFPSLCGGCIHTILACMLYIAGHINIYTQICNRYDMLKCRAEHGDRCIRVNLQGVYRITSTTVEAVPVALTYDNSLRFSTPFSLSQTEHHVAPSSSINETSHTIYITPPSFPSLPQTNSIYILNYITTCWSYQPPKGKTWACILSLVGFIADEITSEAPISGPCWRLPEALFRE